MSGAGANGDWSFCFEAVGPVASDTGGLTYPQNFFANLDDEGRRRMVVLMSRPLAEGLGLGDLRVRTLPAFTGSGAGKAFAAQALVPIIARRLKVSAVFCSGSIASAFGGLGSGPKVVINMLNAGPLAGDMVVAGRSRDTYRRVALPAGLRTAARVITPSETTRQDLIERYSLEPGHVSVVPLAVDHDRFHPADDDPSVRKAELERLTALEIQQPYVLFVSALWPYKNATSLVAAFVELVRDRKIPHTLVLAGKDGGDGPRLRELARAHGMADRVILTGHVPDADLPVLYRHADVFVYPSLVESFGLPLLEAMASGAPVVAADGWAIPEVCGGAAQICNATDTAGLAGAIDRVLSSDTVRAEMVERGVARARNFSWSRVVRETLTVIERAATED